MKTVVTVTGKVGISVMASAKSDGLPRYTG